jgi:hypothetical protein
MHQNKPTAPITYLTSNAKLVTLPDSDISELKDTQALHLTLPEIALVQTLVNRYAIDCNRNLNKDVLKVIGKKIRSIIDSYSYKDLAND